MGFVKKNIVVIVMVPSIIGMHFGWTSLQSNKRLVPDHQEISEQPIFTVIKFYNYFVQSLNFVTFRLQKERGHIFLPQRKDRQNEQIQT